MKLTVENFQGHEKSELEFVSPGINAITGNNGHGKSSVFRALKTLVLGGPIDKRHGAKEASVTLDGCSKNLVKAKHSYTINGVKYEALRGAVPLQARDLLRLNEVNFRGQHQPYFLLADSPGAVARAMNELTDLGVIDYVAATLKSEAKSAGDKKKFLEIDIAAKRREVESLNWAVDANLELRGIEESGKALRECSSQIESLQEVITQAESLQDKLSQLPPDSLLETFKALESRLIRSDTTSMEELLTAATRNKQWLDSLPESMEESLTQVRNRLCELPETALLETIVAQVTEYSLDLELCPDPKADILQLSAIEIPEFRELEDLLATTSSLSSRLEELSGMEDWEKSLATVQDAAARATTLGADCDDLTNLFLGAERAKAQLELAEEVYEEAETEFKTLLQAEGVCPLCGGVTNEDCLHS